VRQRDKERETEGAYVFTPVNTKNELFTEVMNTVAKNVLLCHGLLIFIYKGKSVPLQAWRGPEGSRKLRFPDYKTTAQDGGKIVSRTHRPPLPPENTPDTHFC